MGRKESLVGRRKKGVTGVLARPAAMWPGEGARLSTGEIVFRGETMIGAKLKIALLYDLWNEDPVAAAAKDAAAAAVRKPRKKVKKLKKEKTDREEISEALQKLGHEPSNFELDGRPQSLHSLSRCDA